MFRYDYAANTELRWVEDAAECNGPATIKRYGRRGYLAVSMKIVRCRDRHLNVIKHASFNSTTCYVFVQTKLLANQNSLFIELTVLYSVIINLLLEEVTPDQLTELFKNRLFVIVLQNLTPHFLALLSRDSSVGKGLIFKLFRIYSSIHLDPVIYEDLKLFYVKMKFAPAELNAIDISLLAPVSI